MKEKDALTIFGYITLIVAFVFYSSGVPKSEYLGLFFNSMSLGFFGKSAYLRFVKKV